MYFCIVLLAVLARFRIAYADCSKVMECRALQSGEVSPHLVGGPVESGRSVADAHVQGVLRVSVPQRGFAGSVEASSSRERTRL